jgi:hypothetical protein
VGAQGTVTVAEALTPPLVTVIVTAPGCSAVT